MENKAKSAERVRDWNEFIFGTRELKDVQANSAERVINWHEFIYGTREPKDVHRPPEDGVSRDRQAGSDDVTNMSDDFIDKEIKYLRARIRSLKEEQDRRWISRRGMVDGAKKQSHLERVNATDIPSAVAAKEALEGVCIYDGGFCKLHTTYSRHTDLSIKVNNDRSKDYTLPTVQVLNPLQPADLGQQPHQIVGPSSHQHDAGPCPPVPGGQHQ